MKKMILILAAIIFAAGCHNVNDWEYDSIPPTPPRNINTITGDNRVDIYWQRNTEPDLAGYNVYFSYSYDGTYELIGTTYDNYFVDYGARNGVTYYYAVTAFDYNNNESELSYDVVYDTPRPEGFDRALFDLHVSPSNSGYDFSDYSVVPYDGEGSDFFFEKYEGIYYLNVWEDTDIQDMGPTYDIYDISFAPTDGWVPINDGENIKYVEAIPGHTYVIWTWDNRYAKVRISAIAGDRMIFDWAYQTVEGNRQLKINRKSIDRKNLSLQRKGR